MPNGAPTVELIQHCVAAHFGLEPGALRSDRRDAPTVRARKIAGLLCQIMTEHSAGPVGRMFKRDPSVIRRYWRDLRAAIRTDRDLAETVDALREEIAAAQWRAEHAASCADRSPSKLRQEAREKSEEVAQLLAEADALEAGEASRDRPPTAESTVGRS